MPLTYIRPQHITIVQTLDSLGPRRHHQLHAPHIPRIQHLVLIPTARRRIHVAARAVLQQPLATTDREGVEILKGAYALARGPVEDVASSASPAPSRTEQSMA